MPIENPITREAKCDSCDDQYPVTILSTYVDEKKDKKGNITQQAISACPICIAEKAGKRMGLKEPYDFSADPVMTQKMTYATQLKEQRSTSKPKKRSSSDDDNSDDDSDDVSEATKKRLEEEAQLQQEIDEEERLKKEQEETNMIDTSRATSAQKIDDPADDGPRRRGTNK